jgi:hypothetical protein
MPYYPVSNEFKPLLILRSFDDEGRTYPIKDDDLDECFSKSDFAKGKRR